MSRSARGRVRIITVTNALRHASATRCTVVVRPDDVLHLEVSDNGSGTGPWHPGIGLRSMAERIAELGGYLATGPQSTAAGCRLGGP